MSEGRVPYGAPFLLPAKMEYSGLGNPYHSPNIPSCNVVFTSRFLDARVQSVIEDSAHA